MPGGYGVSSDGRDAPFELVDLHPLGLAVRDLGIGVGRLHRRLQVRQVHLGRQARDVALGVHLVDALAQVAQPHALVARVLWRQNSGRMRHIGWLRS